MYQRVPPFVLLEDQDVVNRLNFAVFFIMLIVEVY